MPRFSQSNFHRRLIFVYTRACVQPARDSLRKGVANGGHVLAFSIFFERSYYSRLDNAPLRHFSRTLFLLSFPVEIAFIEPHRARDLFHRLAGNDLRAEKENGRHAEEFQIDKRHSA